MYTEFVKGLILGDLLSSKSPKKDESRRMASRLNDVERENTHLRRLVDEQQRELEEAKRKENVSFYDDPDAWLERLRAEEARKEARMRALDTELDLTREERIRKSNASLAAWAERHCNKKDEE